MTRKRRLKPGFMLLVEMVTPIRRKRGIFRDEYQSETFRGIPLPRNRYAASDVPVAAE